MNKPNQKKYDKLQLLLVADKKGRYPTDLKTARKVKQIVEKYDSGNRLRIVKSKNGRL